LVAGVALAFAYGYEMALLLLGLFPVIAGAGFLQVKAMAGSSKEGKQTREKANKLILEASRSFRTVTAFDCGQHMSDQALKRLVDMKASPVRLAITTGFSFGLSMFFHVWNVRLLLLAGGVPHSQRYPQCG